MNNKFLLTEILEGCEGMEFYTTTHGNAKLVGINDTVFPLEFRPTDFNVTIKLSPTGGYTNIGECIVFPSKDQRDWSKFEKPSKFPKTYADAHQMLSTEEGVDLSDDMCELISLLEARNAYWKVDGNWKPDWSASSTKYVIYYYGGEIELDGYEHASRILAFRTREIRDEFYKNFKCLIRACKDYI